jgi:AcrR family transcriptional regulator
MKKQSSKRQVRSPRVKQKFEQARNDILEAARRILLDGGMEAVTLASVAGELQMTKQALYHYFPSKEALVRSLVTALLDDEVNELIAAVESAEPGTETLGLLMRTFYRHYIGRLNAFRSVYCQSQLYGTPELGLDRDTLREEINPRTRHLFDVLEDRISSSSASMAEREEMRQLAFAAWLSALGLMTMLGIADANDDPLIHSDEELLDTLSGVFDNAARR